MFLVTLQLISNAGFESQLKIQRQMFLINCPAPSYDGEYNASNVDIDGFAVLLDTAPANVTFGGLGTVFRCFVDGLSTPPGYEVIMSNKDYQVTTLGFPSGWFIYAGDFIGSSFQRLTQVFTLISYFVTPTNFNILGFTLEDLSGIALMMVVSLYALCYIAIGVLVYKILSPFAGG